MRDIIEPSSAHRTSSSRIIHIGLLDKLQRLQRRNLFITVMALLAVIVSMIVAFFFARQRYQSSAETWTIQGLLETRNPSLLQFAKISIIEPQNQSSVASNGHFVVSMIVEREGESLLFPTVIIHGPGLSPMTLNLNSAGNSARRTIVLSVTSATWKIVLPVNSATRTIVLPKPLIAEIVPPAKPLQR